MTQGARAVEPIQSDEPSIDRAGGTESIKLEEYLVARGAISAAVVARARQLARETSEPLHLVITRLGQLTEAALAEHLSEGLGLPFADYAELQAADPDLMGELSQRFMLDRRVLPLRRVGKSVVAAFANPLDRRTIEALGYATHASIEPVVATASDIEGVLQARPQRAESAGGDEPKDAVSTSDDAARLRELGSDAPIIRLVNRWIATAVDRGVSDIHIEPTGSGLELRHRIDGDLHPIETCASEFGASVSARVKVLARLDIAERRLPQDGKIRMAVRGRDVDIRVSVVPCVHGEAIVLRILDRSGVTLDLEALGYSGSKLDRLLGLLDQPHGIVLVTGPTGSGKTTTLYAGLLRIRSPKRKILTIEDPVEYQLPGIVQMQVNPGIGLGFAEGLRSFLRHDPDVILVGEIRDEETARVAIQAALTGHLVLSTLHTNDAASTVARLLDMGVEPYLIAATLRGVVAQRLVRRRCPACSAAGSARNVHPPLSTDQVERTSVCAACRGEGYAGRTTIAEVMVMDEALRLASVRRSTPNEITYLALDGGMVSLRTDGERLVQEGVTNLEEILRVTQEI